MNEKIGYEEPFAPSLQPSMANMEKRLQCAEDVYRQKIEDALRSNFMHGALK